MKGEAGNRSVEDELVQKVREPQKKPNKVDMEMQESKSKEEDGITKNEEGSMEQSRSSSSQDEVMFENVKQIK